MSRHQDVIVDAEVRSILTLAGRAPSFGNTQPWRWERCQDGVDLVADQTRGPVGRTLVISCGAVLHHAQVVAEALGWHAHVEPLPDGPTSDRLARLTFGAGTVPDDAAQQLDAVRTRCTDRRRFTAWPVPDSQLHALAAVAAVRGAHAVPVVDVTDRFRVDRLVERAHDQPLPDHEVGELESSDGLVVLCGYDDARPDWLRTGEALSALWLRATIDGLSVVPLSQVIEVEATRLSLQHDVLGGLVAPHLLVRLGWQAISRGQVARTPRRPLDDVLVERLRADVPVDLGTFSPSGPVPGP